MSIRQHGCSIVTKVCKIKPHLHPANDCGFLSKLSRSHREKTQWWWPQYWGTSLWPELTGWWWELWCWPKRESLSGVADLLHW